MGRSPSYDASMTKGDASMTKGDASMTKGAWSNDEDVMLKSYIEANGAGNWKQLPKLAGLKRYGKSCRLRWVNYLRPDIKRGNFSEAEEKLIINLHSVLGNKWSGIAAQMEGRTDNEIKNYWNTTIKKKLLMKGIDPVTHKQRTDINIIEDLPNLIAGATNLNIFAPNPLNNNAFQQIPPNTQQLIQNLIHTIINPSLIPKMEAISLLQSLIALHNLNHSLSGSLINYGGCNPNEFDIKNSGVGASTSTITENTATTSYYSAPTTSAMLSLQMTTPENVLEKQAMDEENLGDFTNTTSNGLFLDDLDLDFNWDAFLKACNDREIQKDGSY